MYSSLIIEAAKLIGISPTLLLAVCFQESSLRNIQWPDGTTLTYGVCGVKLDTARDIYYNTTVSDLMNPFTNAKIAAKYLRKLLTRYHGRMDCALNAYNAGPSRTTCTNAPLNVDYIRRINKHIKKKPWKYVKR